jgi:nucleotide-binding universal stress UspA family protein
MVASAIDCPLVLAHVTTPEDSGRDEGWLDDLAAASGVEACTTTVVDHRTPATGLLSLQAGRADSLLVLATVARSGVGELLLGSTAAEVARRSARPVLLVGPAAAVSAGDAIKIIQVCVDGSEAGEAAAATAAVWALLLDARLHLVRVAPPTEPGAPHDDVTDLAALAHDLRRSIAVHAEWEVLHADRPGPALVEHARHLPASLVVVTGPQRHDPVARLLTSTAARVVHDAPCPVLLLPRHEGPPVTERGTSEVDP